ncbi:MAG: GGDEF domain-containing protein [Clostridia bacterium]|nr:GGDEF domain-containing protein [Clostridia bacterium]
MADFRAVVNQYGFDTDIFDKYRDAVTRSNRESIQVLSCIMVGASLLTIAFGYATHQPMEGLYVCLYNLVCGIAGMLIAFRKDSPRLALLTVGYLLSLGAYSLSIYGSLILETDAFWFGTQAAVGCYLFDYAWRVGLLQFLSFLGLCISWIISSPAPIGGTRVLFAAQFLLIGLITTYMLNRTRASMILSREETKKASETDLLTGLTTRIAAQQEIESSLQSGDQGVLMLLDLDQFKSVNDLLGHQMGDKVLVEVAADMKKLFRSSDVISRLGGDEFMLYLKNVHEQAWAMQRATQIVQVIRRWVISGSTSIEISASIGIVMTDMVERSYDSLYHAADIAMYTAKRDGGNKAMFFSPDMVADCESSLDGVHTEAD